MSHIIIKNSIVRKVNPHDLAYQIPKSGGSIPVKLQNGDLQYDTNEADRNQWNSLNEPKQEALFRKYFKEHTDLEQLIEESRMNR